MQSAKPARFLYPAFVVEIVKWMLLLVGIAAVIVAIDSHSAVVAVTARGSTTPEVAFQSLISDQTGFQDSTFGQAAAAQLVDVTIPSAILAASLGILGALVWVLYGAIGAMKSAEVDLSDVYSNTTRLFLGGLSGWALMFLFFGSRFPDDKLLLVPFVSGFSTDLVLGVINQAVKVVKGTMGIADEVATRPTRRTARAGKAP